MTTRRIRIGTRGSALALRQTETVAALLQRAHPGLEVVVEAIRTDADRRPDTPFEALPGIGFFVKELEAALLQGRIDVAVHSMKDLPTVDTAGVTVGAVTAREDPRDVLAGREGATLASLPPRARVGTSSPRRAAFLRAHRPDLEIVPIRGNVETRLRKVDANELDAVCLAGAGLRRLGLADRITEWIPIVVMLPAPGQGALGIQVRVGDAETAGIAAAADESGTRLSVAAERGLLARLLGGCRLPAGAYAEVRDGMVRLQAAVVAADGGRAVRGERSGSATQAEAVGRALAEELLGRGAGDLMPREAIS